MEYPIYNINMKEEFWNKINMKYADPYKEKVLNYTESIRKNDTPWP